MKYSIVKLSNIKSDNNLYRFDPEFYDENFVKAEEKVKKHRFKLLDKIISTLTDYHANGSYEVLRKHVELFDEPNFSLMVRTVDFEKDDFDNKVKYISKKAYEFLKKTKVYGKEIIINKIGNPGQTHIMPNLDRKVSLGMNQFMIVPNEDIKNEYFYAFLTCEYGKKLINRRITGTVPLSIDKETLKSIPVPLFDKIFQNLIKKKIDSFLFHQNNSKKKFYEAEKILLDDLGLYNWNPGYKNYFIKNFSKTESFKRFDSEYFNPLYEQLINKIKSYDNGSDNLNKLILINDDNFDPVDKEYYNYIELSHISSNGIINKIPETQGDLLPTRARRIVKTNDVLISSVEGSLSSIALINSDLNNYLCSTGFFLLTSDKFNPETLMVLMKSIVGQLQLKKGCSGTILTAITKEELKKITLPIIKKKIQENIKKKIIEMYKEKSLALSELKNARRLIDERINKS